ncbi:MAG: OmpA family protein [Bacteroidota bacterium]
MKRAITSSVLIILIMALLSAGCGTNKATRGGAIGAAAGGVIGGAIGSRSGNTAVGAIIGAAVGGTAGALIGNYMDKQAEEMKRDVEGARVERIGEGIKITFPSGILFETNSSELQPEAQDNIVKLAKILNKYKDTNVLIEGHTDSDGTDAYNQKLSERRAAAVTQYAESNGVSSSRITMKGYGESQPVASNDSPDGKRQNRRVEIAIFANEKLKKAAEDGNL